MKPTETAFALDELRRLLSDPPEYGRIEVSIVLHEGKLVRLENRIQNSLIPPIDVRLPENLKD